MFPIISGSTMRYLAGMQKTQDQLNQTQSQITSGKRVQQASDDPGAISAILQKQSDIALNQQVQSNLNNAKSELTSADSALQSVISILEKAQTLATQGASSTPTPDERAALAQQVAGLQAELVSLSQTQSNGRYIFSGDQDSQPAYKLDSSQPEGVQQLLTAPATRTIVDASGTAISVALTAQQIFDPRNPDNSPATGNVFAAVNNLLTSLQNNDVAGVQQAAADVKSADAYVNQQLAFYGTAENRVDDAANLARLFQTQMEADLSQSQDTDVAKAAVALSQLQVQQQAAISVESNLLQMKNIFNYIA